MKRKGLIIGLVVLAFGMAVFADKKDVGFKAPSYLGTANVGSPEQGATFLIQPAYRGHFMEIRGQRLHLIGYL